MLPAIASWALLLFTVGTAAQVEQPPVPVPPSSVVVGTLQFVRLHDQRDYEQARALYDHTNLQPLVVDVEQTLLGPSVEGTVIVFVDVVRAPQYSIKWRGSYGILSASEWKAGERLVLRLDAQRYGVPCEMWLPPSSPQHPSGPAESGDDDLPVLGTGSFNPELESYKGASAHCASLANVFRLEKGTK